MDIVWKILKEPRMTKKTLFTLMIAGLMTAAQAGWASWPR